MARMLSHSFAVITILFMSSTANAQVIKCDEHAAVVDGQPLDNSLYSILTENAKPISNDVYEFAPINGGRYWVRADYADGVNHTPYPHLGCFADLRIGIAWACSADREFVKKRFGCNWRAQRKAITLPESGCVALPVRLREPIVYCAPGASPSVER
jgi:hypothetical protein